MEGANNTVPHSKQWGSTCPLPARGLRSVLYINDR